MRRTFFYSTIALFISAIFFSVSCEKQEFDAPPAMEIPVGEVYDLQQLKDLYVGQPIQFDTAMSVYAVVSADETSGNLYRNIYVQDATGGINLRLKNPGGLYQGDSVRIYLNGLILGNYSGVMQLDSVDVDRNIIKLKTNVMVEPKVVTIPELSGGNYTGQLIQLDGVEFSAADTSQTWSDAIGLTTVNRILKDCDNNTVIVRTSGYANFAGVSLPNGNGSFIAVASRFNNDIQLYVRNVSEIQLNGTRCDGGGGVEPGDPVTEFFVDFENQANEVDISLTGWINVATAGNRVWRGRSFDDNLYAQATAFNSSDALNETWLITPPILLDEMDEPKLEFLNAMAFWTHAGLTVSISTDFNGSDIAGATWQPLTFNMADQSSGNYNWVESGVIDLSSFSGTAYIGFKYSAAAPQGQTGSFILDDIQLYDGEGGGGGGGSQTTIFSELFTNDIGTFAKYSVTGSQDWGWAEFDGGCMVMSGYQQNQNNENEDWLVSPAISLEGKTDVTMSFREAINFITNISDMQVLIAVDYDGSSTPDQSGTWNEVTGFTRAPGNNWTFIDSGEVSLASYEGQTIHIAFKYTSTNSASATWEVSKVEVKAAQ
jgi:hypothetical protein